MRNTLYYCDRCGAPMDRKEFTAYVHAQIENVEDEPDYFEYRLCAPCWCGYRNTFNNKEGE